jgi:hypothetical protein
VSLSTLIKAVVVRVPAQGATTTAQGFMGQSQGVPGETVRRLLEHACRLLCKLLNDVRPLPPAPAARGRKMAACV